MPGKKRPFRVFEAGMGTLPVGLLQKAMLKRGGRKRVFAGTDVKKVNLDKLLKSARLKKTPANLELMQRDAIAALRELKPESQSVIFASYLCNCLSHKKERQAGIQKQKNILFLEEAKRALRPGGRLVLIQDKATISYYKELAMNLGMGYHQIELSDKIAQNSPAEFIRERSTPQKRLERNEKYLSYSGMGFIEDLQELLESRKIESEEEYARPTAMIFRKPRKGEIKIQAVTAIGVAKKIAPLSPQEQSIVNEILGLHRP